MRIQITLSKPCPNCNSRQAIFLIDNGELICSECGLVLDKNLVTLEEADYVRFGGIFYGQTLQAGLQHIYKKVCPQCGVMFATHKMNKRFCSEGCRKKFWILNRHNPKYEAELARKKHEKTTQVF